MIMFLVMNLQVIIKQLWGSSQLIILLVEFWCLSAHLSVHCLQRYLPAGERLGAIKDMRAAVWSARSKRLGTTVVEHLTEKACDLVQKLSESILDSKSSVGSIPTGCVNK